MRLRRYITIVATFSCLLLVGCSSANETSNVAAITQSQFQTLDSYIQQQITDNHVPGGCVAVVQNGKIVHFMSFGVANIKTGAPITQDTEFAIGSLTKSLTATAILQLRDKGLLKLTDPVQKYLPWFKVANHADSSKITIYDLLTQSSGLIRVDANKVGEALQNSGQYSLTDAVRALANISLNYQPGTSWSYCNTNYDVLGLIVQTISGEPYTRYMDTKVLQPLEMDNTTFDVTQFDSSRLAGKYVFLSGSSKPYAVDPAGKDLAYDDPAGSRLVSNVSDMAKYVTFELGSGPRSVLSQSSITEAHTNGFPMSAHQTYAYGWVDVNQTRNNAYQWHDGETEGSKSLIVLDESKDAGVIVFENTSDTTEPDTWQIYQIINGQTPQ